MKPSKKKHSVALGTNEFFKELNQRNAKHDAEQKIIDLCVSDVVKVLRGKSISMAKLILYAAKNKIEEKTKINL